MQDDHELLENLSFAVDEREPVIVKAIHFGYPNNRYVSLRDTAGALSGTSKQFQTVVDAANTSILTGKEYVPLGGEGEPFPERFQDGRRYVYSTNPLRTISGNPR